MIYIKNHTNHNHLPIWAQLFWVGNGDIELAKIP